MSQLPDCPTCGNTFELGERVRINHCCAINACLRSPFHTQRTVTMGQVYEAVLFCLDVTPNADEYENGYKHGNNSALRAFLERMEAAAGDTSPIPAGRA